MFRREMGSKRGSLPPKEGDLTCMRNFSTKLVGFYEKRKVRLFDETRLRQK